MSKNEKLIGFLFAAICAVVVYIFFCGPYHQEEEPKIVSVSSPSPLPIIDPKPQNVDLESKLSDDILKVAVKDLFTRYDKPTRYRIYMDWDHTLQGAPSDMDAKLVDAQMMGKYDITNLQLKMIQQEGFETDVENVTATMKKL